MQRSGRARTVISASLLLAACGQRDLPPRPQSETLPEGIVARVGDDEDVSATLVGAIARAQGKSPAAARDLAISDALWASYARQLFQGTGRIQSAERAALARFMLEQLRTEVVKLGPPSDQEIEELTRLRWQEVARPPLARTIHAVVLVKSPDQEDKARRVADRLSEALRGATDPADFEKRAKDFDAEGLDIKVEQLLPVAPDGRLADPRDSSGEPQMLEQAFARAAHAIGSVGEQSPVVRSSYGFHVILLLERLGERMLSLEERRNVLASEIYDRRAKAAHQRLLEQVNKTLPVTIERGAEELLQQVRIER